MLVNNDSFTKGMKYKKYSACKGFSLLEVMTAIFLITAGLLAAVTLLVSGLKDSMDSRNQITAGLLAQEGVELVRNIRDNNWANNIESFDNNDFPGSDANNCRADINSSDVKSCNNGQDFSLYYSNLSYYDHNSSGTQTKFKRKIEVLYDTGTRASAKSATITSIVIWGNSFPSISSCNAVNRCVYTEIVLTKWGE